MLVAGIPVCASRFDSRRARLFCDLSRLFAWSATIMGIPESNPPAQHVRRLFTTISMPPPPLFCGHRRSPNCNPRFSVPFAPVFFLHPFRPRSLFVTSSLSASPLCVSRGDQTKPRLFCGWIGSDQSPNHPHNTLISAEVVRNFASTGYWYQV